MLTTFGSLALKPRSPPYICRHSRCHRTSAARRASHCRCAAPIRDGRLLEATGLMITVTPGLRLAFCVLYRVTQLPRRRFLESLRSLLKCRCHRRSAVRVTQIRNLSSGAGEWSTTTAEILGWYTITVCYMPFGKIGQKLTDKTALQSRPVVIGKIIELTG